MSDITVIINDQPVSVKVSTGWKSADTRYLQIVENLADLSSIPNAQENLEVDPAGTDNSTNVSLAGTPNYLTLAGQVITLEQIDLAADVQGTLPIANGGTGLSAISGSTFPTSPTEGMLFLLSVTGRKVLYQYDGSAWVALFGIGDYTVYVDGTDGTDSATSGTGIDANAYATISYAISQLPTKITGNLYILVASGTYNETVEISSIEVGVNKTITFNGETTTDDSGTITSAVQGSGATRGAVTDTTKSWTIDEHRGKWVVAQGDKFPIISNTADTVTVAGVFTATPSGSYSIIDNGVILSGTGKSIAVDNQYKKITFNHFSTTSSAQYAIRVDGKSSVDFYYLKHNGTSSGFLMRVSEYSTVLLRASVFDRAGAGYIVVYQASLTIWNGIFDVSYISAENSFISVGLCTDIGGSSWLGLYATNNGSISCYTSSAGGYNHIHDCSNGIRANSGGVVTFTANNQYSGNTTDENADAASFGYID